MNHLKKMMFVVFIFQSLAFYGFASDDKSACQLNYKLLGDETDDIFYYEINKYNPVALSFKNVKQWYCEELIDDNEVKELMKANCTVVNMDGVAIKPNSDGSFNISLGCG